MVRLPNVLPAHALDFIITKINSEQEFNLYRLTFRLFMITIIFALTIINIIYAGKMIVLNMNDFGKLYYASLGFLNGYDINIVSPAMILPISKLEFSSWLNLNPPHLILFLIPFGLLAPKIALTVWSIINLICLWASLFIVFRELEISIDFTKLLIIILCLLAFSGTSAVIATGQFSFILMLAMTIYWKKSRNDKWLSAGFYLGILIGIKLFMLIFLPYLFLRKKWGTIIMALAVTISLYCLGIFITGWHNYIEWINNLRAVDWGWAGMNSSIMGILIRLFSGNPQFYNIIDSNVLVNIMWVVFSGAIGCATLWLTYIDRSKLSLDRSYVLLLLAAQLISPLGWIYFLFMIFGPLFTLISNWQKNHMKELGQKGRLSAARPILIIIICICFIVPITAVTDMQPNIIITAFWGSIYFWATLFLWVLLSIDSKGCADSY